MFKENPFLKTRLQPLFCLLLAGGLFLLLAVMGPQQIPVIFYKLLLPLLGGAITLFAWIALVPMANPARYLASNWRCNPDADVEGDGDFHIAPGFSGVFRACILACALVFAAGAMAVSMGL